MKKDIQNQIKHLAEMKRLCQENPTQIDRLKEYQYEAMAFDWDEALISDDMVLVPREPTEAMIDAGQKCLEYCNSSYNVYEAMIAAYEDAK